MIAYTMKVVSVFVRFRAPLPVAELQQAGIC
jgi:hypothetical protein